MIELYDKVIVDTPPECPAEFDCHGIRPCTRGLTGQVVRIDEGQPSASHPDHYYEVALSNGHHGWFAIHELRLLYDAIADGSWPPPP